MNDKKRTAFEVSRRGAFSLVGGAAFAAALPGTARAKPETLDHVKSAGQDAMFDPLTGLPNEALFCDRASMILRLGHHDLTVAIIEIDHLERIQPYRATTADVIRTLVIVVMARRICRFADMYPRSHTIGRLGEGQFGVLLADAYPRSTQLKLEGLRRAIRAPLKIGREMAFNASIGIMHNKNHSYKHDELITGARQAAADARQSGTGRIRFYDGTPIV